MDFTYEYLNKYKNDTFVIWRPSQHEEILFSYYQIIKISKILLQILKENKIPQAAKICIQFDSCPEIIVAILSIINLPGSFCPISNLINYADTVVAMKHYQVNYIITSKSFDTQNNQQLSLLAKFCILNSTCYLYERNGSNLYEKSSKIIYSLKTSGTTGNPKVIQVPPECIKPNVVELSKLFKVTNCDVIFAVSPPTFDPFVLDLFLAMHNGASILLTTQIMLLKTDELIKILYPQTSNKKGITILQITPSIFRLFKRKFIQECFLDENSSLRILVFGGEEFPSINEIKSWLKMDLPKSIRIFNIYGLTEISCWSTIEELKTIEIDEISLGLPIDNDTILEVRNTETSEIIDNGIGELFIGSSIRKCVLNDENLDIIQNNEVVFRSTGDLVEISNVPEVKYYYKGRKNEIIKRYGNCVNLKKIEDYFKLSNIIDNAACIFDKNNLLLLFLIKHDHKTNLDIEKLITKLLSKEKPDKIIYVDKFPLSCHGKVSKAKLLKLHEKQITNGNKNITETLNDIFINIFGFTLPDNTFGKPKISKNTKNIWKSSFLSLGGTSFQAIYITSEIERFFQVPCPNIMKMLLNENMNLSDILEYCNKLPKIFKKINTISVLSDSIELKVLWKHNSLKCVDASPTIREIGSNENLISVGSHSHLVICLECNGKLRSQFELPDRIESEIVFDKDNLGYVGCYDGYLYKFNINTGKIITKFNSMGMIKCKPIIIENNIIFGNYSDNENLFCFNIKEHKLIWSIKLGTKGILSSPIQLSLSNILVCTLDGTFSKINITNGSITWIKKYDSPIFSTSSVLLQDNFIIIGEVSGLIHVLDYEGSEIINYKVDGTIFSSFEIIDNNATSKIIIFGSFDWFIYCLKFDINFTSIKLLWKCKLQSQIYSTPKIINLNNQLFVISCTSVGYLNVINYNTGVLLKYIQLNGEIFSTPAILNNKIYVGCRDNYLYAIEIDNKF